MMTTMGVTTTGYDDEENADDGGSGDNLQLELLTCITCLKSSLAGH